jgi:exonuclease V
MPVFGFVQDQAIIGIIVRRGSIFRLRLPTRDQDEISLKPLPQIEAESNSPKRPMPTSAPGTPQKSKKPRTSSPSQPELTDFFPSPSKGKARKSASPPSRPTEQELFILDTKTRRSNSLPSDDDAYSSRMQLMLYHHLLSALLAPTFPFHTFWEKIRADPFAELSDAFLLQCGLAHQTDDVIVQYFSNLDDLTSLWHTTVRSMHVRGLSPTLEIVYRAQSKRSKKDDFAEAEREARDIARAITSSIRESDHDPDLERAIAESLRDMVPATDADVGGNAQASSPRATEQPSEKTHVHWYAPEGVTEGSKAMGSAWPREVPSAPQEPSSSERELLPLPKGPRIIGRKSFVFDRDAMNAHVQNVMQWWRGERTPRGVDIEHVHRCL